MTAVKNTPVFTPDGSRVAYTAKKRDSSSEWETVTVPVTGGPSTTFMANAAGLRWIGNGRILFSEVMAGTVAHMGIVTSLESRAEERQIYFPAHERAMMHYTYLSPDQKSILAVEMDPTGGFAPCQFLPMEGQADTAARPVGPSGSCTAAAWSPDGKWMYFNTRVDEATHIWRQRFPDGTPEQITMGPNEEEGLAIDPNGQSLISSVGVHKSSIWMHDATGEHLLSPEGFATSPRFSAEGDRVYYMLRKTSSKVKELWFTERASGMSHPALPGVALVDFDISRDGLVAFTARKGSDLQIFIAPLDGRAPPRKVVNGDTASFGSAGELIFRQLEPHANYLARVKFDGSGEKRILDKPVANFDFVSPDGNWGAVAGVGGVIGTFAVSLKDGAQKKICVTLCSVRWSADGAYMNVSLNVSPTDAHPTFVFPIPKGASWPPGLPVDGVGPKTIGTLRGIQKIAEDSPAPGPDPQTYVFMKADFVGNLFRIPLH